MKVLIFVVFCGKNLRFIWDEEVQFGREERSSLL